MKSRLSHKNFFVVVLCASVLGLAAGVAKCETYGGGSGTADEPYLIYDANQMNAIGVNPLDWGSRKHFRLMVDIDLGGYAGTEFNIIGKFRGVFDGNGHTISNLGSRAGLFSCVDGDNAVIRNLGLIDPNVYLRGGGVGSLVGVLKNGIISGCWSDGGSVTGDFPVGGLVGSNWNGTISACYSSSNATDYGGFLNSRTGGLVGSNSGKVYNCYSTGLVTTPTSGSGGLVGRNSGTVLNSFWDIQTSGQTTSAGGVGKTTAQMQDPNTFLNAGWDFAGEYKNGPSDIWVAPVGGGYMVLWWQLSPFPVLPSFSGGTGEPNDPYLISTASDLNKIGYNPRLMKAHFKLVDDIDLTGLRFFNIANAGNPFMGVFDGNGHTISNFSYHSNGIDCIGLFAYIDGSNAQIKDLGLINPDIAAGTGDWVGSMVGQIRDGAITGCWCDRCGVTGHDSVGGLVGFTYHANISNSYSNGSVSGRANLGGLVGGNLGGDISGSYSSCSVSGGGGAGGLVGIHALGNISNSHSTGTVLADTYWQTGGLVGRNSKGTITNSYSLASVVGITSVGGLAGSNDRGSISNSYSGGSVQGDNTVGGLVGENLGSGTITDCYSTGSVTGTSNVGGLAGWNNATVSASFWDIQTSGEPNSAAGTALPTAEMQTKSTFTDAGWDFTTPIWTIDEGNDYPRLWWENAAPVACIVGGDRTVEVGSGGCEAKVTLDGSCSSDADSNEGTNDDIVYFDWYDVVDVCDPNSDIYIGSGEVIECNLPLGEHDIVLEVIDKAGAFDANEVTITVEDTMPPEFALAVSPDVLWPANHKMVLITPSWEMSDNCDELPEVTLVSITSNEDDDAKGDGHTSDDIRINDKGIWLRAERSGKRAGRVYTITYQAVDGSGNVTLVSATVTVPHDRTPPRLRRISRGRLRHMLLRRLRSRVRRYR